MSCSSAVRPTVNATSTAWPKRLIPRLRKYGQKVLSRSRRRKDRPREEEPTAERVASARAPSVTRAGDLILYHETFRRESGLLRRNESRARADHHGDGQRGAPHRRH